MFNCDKMKGGGKGAISLDNYVLLKSESPPMMSKPLSSHMLTFRRANSSRD
jgi:hypothetical protein